MIPPPPTLSSTAEIVLLVFFSLIAIPSGILLKRAGHNPLWAVLCYVPPLAIIGLWVLALTGPKTDAGA